LRKETFPLKNLEDKQKMPEMADTLENPSDAFEKRSDAFESDSDALDALSTETKMLTWKINLK